MTPPPLEELSGDTPVKLPLKTMLWIFFSVVFVVVSGTWTVATVLGAFKALQEKVTSLESRVKVVEDLQNTGKR